MGMSEGKLGEKPAVIFVPGGVMPASMSYGPLLAVIQDEIQARVKDLEVYAADKPPANYSLDYEVEGIRHVADANGFNSFHLVGYSGGGAFSLAFTARYPTMVNSLALIEPAWIGNDNWTAEDRSDWAELDRVMSLPENERMRQFAIWQMRPGVQPPSLPLPATPPAWMSLRPAGLNAISLAFKKYQLNKEKFRTFSNPVYYAYGSLGRDFYPRNSRTLASYFPNFQEEAYEGRSHFDPPHRAEPERFANVLRKLWM